MQFIGRVCGTILHWLVFGIGVSLLPFAIFVNLTEETLGSGFLRILREAAFDGDLYLMMIPILGGLLGQTVTNTFYSKLAEVIAAGAGIMLLSLVIGAAYDFRSMSPEQLVETKRRLFILNGTQELFTYMVAYAVMVMLLSASHTVAPPSSAGAPQPNTKQ